MRYYAIQIDGAPAAFQAVPGALVSGAQFSSVANGQNDPGALRVQMYISQVAKHRAEPGSWIRIWGVSLQMINQSANLAGKNIKIYGGMYPGLPLATSQSVHKGLLIQGMIKASFGNWEGTNQSLDILLLAAGSQTADSSSNNSSDNTTTSTSPPNPNSPPVFPGQPLMKRKTRTYGISTYTQPPGAPSQQDVLGGSVASIASTIQGILSTFAKAFGGGGYAAKPINIVHNAQPNQQLSSVIQQTLKTAFPNATLDIQISPNLKLNYQHTGFYQSLEQYALAMRSLSLSIMGTTNYEGISIWTTGNIIHVKDGTQQSSNNVNIDYTDLIGQPTWIGLNTINFKTVMRGDLDIGTMVTLPAGTPTLIGLNANNTPSGTVGSSVMPSNLQLTFTGPFKIQKLLHVGDSRHPDGAQWCTVVEEAVGNQVGQGSTPSTNSAATPTPLGQGGIGHPQIARRKVRRYA